MMDSYKHKGLRKQLVETIKKKGITDLKVLEAIGKIPRHLFLDSTFQNHAYEDKAFPIGSGQTISQPYTVAFQTELLKIKNRDKVLEVGTGSGYQACVLLELGAIVYTIERQKNLYLKTKEFLPTISYQPKLFYGDGYKGLPAFAPFDKIIVTAGAPDIPDMLIQQLKPGGIMVIPVGNGGIQSMITITKNDAGEVKKQEHGTFRFVPLLENRANDK
ncbi:MAG: protein-L-isoaspartate(D-aspartate) O-methyltransferase [Bacteroidota bacterium]